MSGNGMAKGGAAAPPLAPVVGDNPAFLAAATVTTYAAGGIGSPVLGVVLIDEAVSGPPLSMDSFPRTRQIGSRLELRDWIELFERRRERIGKTPHGPQPNFLVLRFELKVMYGAGEVFGSLEFALHKRFVDHQLCRDIRQVAPLLHLYHACA